MQWETMDMVNQQVEFESEVQEKFWPTSRESREYTQMSKDNQKLSTLSDLQMHGSRPIVPKILPRHLMITPPITICEMIWVQLNDWYVMFIHV